MAFRFMLRILKKLAVFEDDFRQVWLKSAQWLLKKVSKELIYPSIQVYKSLLDFLLRYTQKK